MKKLTLVSVRCSGKRRLSVFLPAKVMGRKTVISETEYYKLLKQLDMKRGQTYSS
jgi:hypothetical protein